MWLPLNALFKTTTNGLMIINPRQTKACVAFKELRKVQKEAVITVQPNKLEEHAQTLKDSKGKGQCPSSIHCQTDHAPQFGPKNTEESKISMDQISSPHQTKKKKIDDIHNFKGKGLLLAEM